MVLLIVVMEVLNKLPSFTNFGRGYLQMLDGSQALLPADELKKRFEQEGKSSFLR